jgi:hypothetical protein
MGRALGFSTLLILGCLAASAEQRPALAGCHDARTTPKPEGL